MDLPLQVKYKWKRLINHQENAIPQKVQEAACSVLGVL